MDPALLQAALAPAGSPLPIPRALLVFAHPDDETLGLGARLTRLAPHATLITVTDGAPQDGADARDHGFANLGAYREARRKELAHALAASGASALGLQTLNLPDQQAVRHLVSLTKQLAVLITELEPEVLFTHPFEGGHPDHDAVSFAVHQACAILPSPPLLIEPAGYHAQPDGTFHPGTFAPNSPTPVTEFALTPDEQARKQAALARFRSQQQTLALFPTTHERFRLAPKYDFTEPQLPAYYDRFPWPLKATDFARLAAEALTQLAAAPTCS